MVKVVEYTLEDEVPPALKARRYFSRIVLRVQTKAAEEGKRYEIRKVQVGDFVLLRTRTYQAGADDEDKVRRLMRRRAPERSACPSERQRERDKAGRYTGARAR